MLQDFWPLGQVIDECNCILVALVNWMISTPILSNGPATGIGAFSAPPTLRIVHVKQLSQNASWATNNGVRADRRLYLVGNLQLMGFIKFFLSAEGGMRCNQSILSEKYKFHLLKYIVNDGSGYLIFWQSVICKVLNNWF